MAKVRHDSFERFYYEKIGLGEGCGCAEHVTRIRDLDALAAQIAAHRARPQTWATVSVWLRSLVAPAGRKAASALARNPAPVSRDP
ncbi:hypothetical protein SAMN04488498_10569 [Mesorhizobium albiziae]|uniref:Uncharacterized protein n=1 Tax=Neomesorhizobium albiziae TaxID=335020 RepID=A0A1I3YNL2_9HYPH|nr:hypothetical protein [Mesorhizobium albiziae]GLS33381.1 hypothetical protein GCM10007937_50920 [Mesorhizobium albiziae]SFK33448.1 hypothetical protein SAMN04488498_10569 [Mesorhizobium albiziae]